jgi:HTH-type transcriptional regulator, competence development regulator
MLKKRRISTSRAVDPTPPETTGLGPYLASIRLVRRLTLREVEEATGGEVSNAYLSQLENNKISRPSPNILHALAKVLSIPYETLMEKAGYLAPATPELDVLRAASPAKKARPSIFDNEKLTPEEEESLLAYLAFLRSRKGGSAKT